MTFEIRNVLFLQVLHSTQEEYRRLQYEENFDWHCVNSNRQQTNEVLVFDTVVNNISVIKLKIISYKHTFNV